jgi:hypothetical protein
MTSNVAVTSTTGLYGITSNVQVPNSASQLLNLLYSNGNVNFSLAPGNTQVQANAMVSSGGGSTYGNANVAAYLASNTDPTISTLNANSAVQAVAINTVNANIGAYQTFANANASSQATSINTINANLGAFQTYANATFGTSSYGNTQATALLANFGSNAISTSGNITGGFFVGNAAALDRTTGAATGTYGSDSIIPTIVVDAKGRITQITTNAISGGGSYGNSNVAAYLASNTDATISNLNANSAVQAVAINSINANLGAYQTYGNVTFSTVANAASQQTQIDTNTTGIATVNANLGAYQTYGNVTFSTVANAASQQTQIDTLQTNAATQATSIDSINANLGAYQTYGNVTFSTIANAASQQTQIDTNTTGLATLNANVGAFETYANLNFGTSTYSNSNVTAYLTGTINVGNILSTGGYFWANGLAYSTGSGGTYGNTDVTAFLNGTAPTNYITGAGNNLNIVGGANTPGSGAILQMAATTIGGFAGPVAYFNSTNVAVASGYFSTSYGPRIDDVIYDTVKGRVFANAFPLSMESTSTPNNATSKFMTNVPTYTNGQLQQPPLANATPGGTGIVSTSSQVIGMIQSANIGFQSGYGFGSQNRDTVNFVSTVGVTPVTANTMSNQDRIRAGVFNVDLNLTGQTYGLMTSSSQNASPMAGINGVVSVNGYGNISAVTGGNYGTFITPAANQTANIQYTSSIQAFTNLLNTAGTTGKANVVYSRGIVPFTTGFSSNLTVQYAVGMHTYSGWAGTGVVGAANNPVLGRFALLNEDANTTIQTNGNLTVTGNTSLAAYTESQQDYGNTGGTITFSVYSASGSVKSLTLTSNLTVNTNNVIMPKGGTLTLIITQDGTGSRTLTSNIKFAGGSKTLSTAAGAIDTVSIYNDGTNLLAALVKGYA